jgi:hypothetical protein
MKLCSITVPFLLSLLLALPSSSKAQENGICEDPISAILTSMDCMAMNDVQCTSDGFAPPPEGVLRYYNGEVENNGEVNDRSFTAWQGIFALTPSLSLVTWNETNIGPNLASMWYNETSVMTSGVEFGLEPSSEYPFGATHFRPNEYAVMEVNGDCELITWTQTGDLEKRLALAKNYDDLLAVPTIYCIFVPMDPNCATDGGDEPTGAPAETNSGEPTPAPAGGGEPTAAPSSSSTMLVPSWIYLMVLVAGNTCSFFLS